MRKSGHIGIQIMKQKITTKPTQDSEIIVHLLTLFFLYNYFFKYPISLKKSLAIMMSNKG